jgi:hypothetical protein
VRDGKGNYWHKEGTPVKGILSGAEWLIFPDQAIDSELSPEKIFSGLTGRVEKLTIFK